MKLRKAAWPLAVSLVMVGILALSVFPTRTYLAQRRGLTATQARVRVLSNQNDELAARVRKLNTDAEIERLAREQYSLVRPGEEAYAILPAPRAAPQGTPPAPTPAPAKKKAKHSFFGLF